MFCFLPVAFDERRVISAHDVEGSELVEPNLRLFVVARKEATQFDRAGQPHGSPLLQPPPEMDVGVVRPGLRCHHQGIFPGGGRVRRFCVAGGHLEPGSYLRSHFPHGI